MSNRQRYARRPAALIQSYCSADISTNARRTWRVISTGPQRAYRRNASISRLNFKIVWPVATRLLENAGRGVTSSEAWPAQSEAMLATRGKSVHITNAGVSSDTNAGMLSRLDSAVPDGTKFVLLDRFGGGWNARRLGKGSQTARFEACLGLTNNIKPGRTSGEGGPICSAKSLSLDSAYATCERTRNQSIRKIMGSTSSITIKKTKNGCGGPTWK